MQILNPKLCKLGPHEKCAPISRFHFQPNFDFSPNFYTLYKISFIFRINSKLPTVFSLKSKMRNNSEASTITVTFITQIDYSPRLDNYSGSFLRKNSCSCFIWILSWCRILIFNWFEPELRVKPEHFSFAEFGFSSDQTRFGFLFGPLDLHLVLQAWMRKDEISTS